MPTAVSPQDPSQLPNGINGKRGSIAATNGSLVKPLANESVALEPPKYAATSYPSNCLRFLKNAVQEEATQHDEGPKPAKAKLDVLVVGAGIGGLATAVALQRQGHDVTVFEQAPELAEVSR